MFMSLGHHRQSRRMPRHHLSDIKSDNSKSGLRLEGYDRFGNINRHPKQRCRRRIFNCRADILILECNNRDCDSRSEDHALCARALSARPNLRA